MNILQNKINTSLKKISLSINKPDFIKQLNALEEKFLKHTGNWVELPFNTKILMGPSFSIHEPCFVHDRLLAMALRQRGAVIVPLYCDQMQMGECNVYGGKWTNTTFEKSCASCINYSWQQWPKRYFNPHSLSAYLRSSDVQLIDEIMGDLKADDWSTFCYDNLAIGRLAKDILVNNYLVGDYHLIADHERLGKQHLKNLFLLYFAYNQVLEQVKPDRVVSNDSYYGMWATLSHLCIKKGIDFYSHWYGGRKDGWCYAFNDAAMNLNFRPSWHHFSKKPLTSIQEDKIKQWLQNRLTGEEMTFNTASTAAHQTEPFTHQILANDKPKALLCANVIWDCAALNKQLIFEDMIDWIAKTIEWFNQHPDYELIIKPHPVEENPLIPHTVETVEKGLAKRGISLGNNVHLLSTKMNLTVYQLLDHVKVGLVHTSTIGMEMAAREMQLVTTAKSPYRGFGFTIDPTTPQEYFECIEKALTGNMPALVDQRQLAYQFIYFYQYHYYSKINLMNYDFGDKVKVLIDQPEQLLPGVNPTFDYFVDAIMHGQPILSETRWMPES